MRMRKLKCVLGLLLLVSPVLGQQLSVRLGNPVAKTTVISAEIKHEGSFELQRTTSLPTNWASIATFNSLPGTNTFTDARTNNRAFYRVFRLNLPPVVTAHPSGTTNFVNQEVRLEAAATGSWPIRYQWMKDGQPVVGGTSNKLTFPGTVGLSGNYTLLISNLWGLALSSPAIIKTVNPVATSISGKKIRYVVKGAQGSYVSNGSFETIYNSAGFFNTVGSRVDLNDAGSWQYGTFPNQPIGRVLIGNDSFIYPNGAAIDLTFTNFTAGTFNLQAANRPGSQFGDFTFID